jgi:hypothetical protein
MSLENLQILSFPMMNRLDTLSLTNNEESIF